MRILLTTLHLCLQFDQLNPASTYVATIGAGLRGQRSMLTVNTPPKRPQSPPAPTVDETSGSKRIVFHGIRSKPEFTKLLRYTSFLKQVSMCTSSFSPVNNVRLSLIVVDIFCSWYRIIPSTWMTESLIEKSLHPLSPS